MKATTKEAPVREARDTVATSVVLATLVASAICSVFVIDVASMPNDAQYHRVGIVLAE